MRTRAGCDEESSYEIDQVREAWLRMSIEAIWRVSVTKRDGSEYRYTERRGRHPEIGEVIEVRDAIGPPLVARIHVIHHDPPSAGELEAWDVAATEIHD
jgi:hypothetical protein